MEVDRHADRALYLQLADVLRDEITSGRLPAGGRLPSETDLIAEHGVSRGTAREAIGVLRSEGLLVVEHGRGAFVHSTDHQSILTHTAGTDPPQRHREAFEHAAAQQGYVASVREIDAERAPAPDVAERLHVPADESIEHRRALYFADGRPCQLVTAYQTSQAGQAPPGSATEEVSVRMPTREERRLLQLDDGSPVIVLRRTLHRRDGAPEEYAVAVIAGERQRLAYHLG